MVFCNSHETRLLPTLIIISIKVTQIIKVTEIRNKSNYVNFNSNYRSIDWNKTLTLIKKKKIVAINYFRRNLYLIYLMLKFIYFSFFKFYFWFKFSPLIFGVKSNPSTFQLQLNGKISSMLTNLRCFLLKRAWLKLL